MNISSWELQNPNEDYATSVEHRYEKCIQRGKKKSLTLPKWCLPQDSTIWNWVRSSHLQVLLCRKEPSQDCASPAFQGITLECTSLNRWRVVVRLHCLRVMKDKERQGLSKTSAWISTAGLQLPANITK